MQKTKSGFTLIELIIYCALIAIFVSGAVRFAWDMVYGQIRSTNQQIAQQEGRFLSLKISQLLRQSQKLVSVSSSSLTVLNYDSTTTTIALQGQDLVVEIANQPPTPLQSNLAKISSLTFTNLSSIDNQSQQLQIEFSLTVKDAMVNSRFGVELSGPFNQARNLLPNTGAIGLPPPYTKIENITLENVGQENLVIDKLSLSWQPNTPEKQLVAVQINGGVVEWVGTKQSSSAFFSLDNPITLTPTSGLILVDYLEFDNSMAGEELFLIFGLADGSFVKGQILLPSPSEITPTPTSVLTPTATPTPFNTPTLTPTPIIINSCQAYCASLGTYTSGVCRQNSVACTKARQVYEPGGDIYCAGGPAADTCCCN